MKFRPWFCQALSNTKSAVIASNQTRFEQPNRICQFYWTNDWFLIEFTVSKLDSKLNHSIDSGLKLRNIDLVFKIIKKKFNQFNCDPSSSLPHWPQCLFTSPMTYRRWISQRLKCSTTAQPTRQTLTANPKTKVRLANWIIGLVNQWFSISSGSPKFIHSSGLEKWIIWNDSNASDSQTIELEHSLCGSLLHDVAASNDEAERCLATVAYRVLPPTDRINTIEATKRVVFTFFLNWNF